MKTQLRFTFLLLLVYGFSQAQQLNEPANWPNAQWTLTGSYDPMYLDENPTGSSSGSFSFDDDDAGGTSINNIAAESPVVDLSAAYTANETAITVAFNYVLNIYQNESLSLQYWDADTELWVNWGVPLQENSGTNDEFCNEEYTAFISEDLNVSAFTSTQLTGFKYRILYDDNGSYGWGFCVNAPVISSAVPPACPNVSDIVISNINAFSAMVQWESGATETSWEIVVQLLSEGIPSSGTLVTSNSYNVSNLSADTDYVVFIRAQCSQGGVSNWMTQMFKTGVDLSTYPVAFTINPMVTTGTYDTALVDLNGDFLDDVISVSNDHINVHYQLPSGGFNEVDITTTPTSNSPNWSIAAGDFDGNGYNDLLYGGYNGVTFMQANSTGTGYTEISGTEYVFSQRSNFVDINNDGYLDAFVCHDVQANVYYLSDSSGNLTFYQGPSTVVPNGLGTVSGGGNYGSVWIDFDNDRDMDLFLAKCRGGSSISMNELWRNDGNGSFVNVADANGYYSTNAPGVGHDNSSNLGDLVQTWSSAWADYDNDGDMDVYVGASTTVDGDSKLMRNNGDGTFTDVTAGSGVLLASLGRENVAVDFDNDGYIDIFSNGDVLFNNGDLTFTNYNTNMPPSGAIGDTNNDGFLDVYYNGNIYLNNTNTNNWIKINTIGTTSNRNGIGARIELETTNGTQIRDVRSGEGFEYMSSLNTHFGIGSLNSITSLTIYWPSGTVDYIQNPDINATLSVTEGSTLSVEDPALVDLSIYPNPVDDTLFLKTTGALVHKIASVFDANGKRVFNEKLSASTVDVSYLAPGVYVLRIESQGKMIKRKFIKN